MACICHFIHILSYLSTEISDFEWRKYVCPPGGRKCTFPASILKKKKYILADNIRLCTLISQGKEKWMAHFAWKKEILNFHEWIMERDD